MAEAEKAETVPGAAKVEKVFFGAGPGVHRPSGTTPSHPRGMSMITTYSQCRGALALVFAAAAIVPIACRHPAANDAGGGGIVA